ncbi:hypothetical protein AB4472_05470 [Vibrio lentus]
MGYSVYASNKPTAPQVNQVESVMFDVPVEATASKPDAVVEPIPESPPSSLDELQAIDFSPTAGVSRPSLPSVDKDSKRALDGLKVRYFSQQNTKVQEAKLGEVVATKAYQAEVIPAPVAKPTPKKVSVEAVSQSQYQQMQLKSVILTPSTARAWVEYQGRLIPVEQGAWIDELKIHRIDKGSVLMMSKTGEEFTLYVPKSLPPVVPSEEEVLNASRS